MALNESTQVQVAIAALQQANSKGDLIQVMLSTELEHLVAAWSLLSPGEQERINIMCGVASSSNGPSVLGEC